MDGSQFDRLTKGMGIQRSRRAAIKALAGTAIAGVLSAVGLKHSVAGSLPRRGPNRMPGQLCRRDEDCAYGYCGSPDANRRRYCQQSCFIGETRIAMVDGTSKAIDQVEIGDAVFGEHGTINLVREIERPLLGRRLLYSLNESEFFVTAEHPFMTESGWKSIDPAATAIENAALNVDRLKVGDRLRSLSAVLVPVMAGGWASDGPAEIRLESVALRSIAERRDDPSTPLYNLLLDGDPTYFANDLLVHNKD